MPSAGANKQVSRMNSGSYSSVTSAKNVLDRQALLAAKQKELDQLFSRHDDLVRSTFVLMFKTADWSV